MNNDGYSVPEAAKLLNVAERTVINWIHSGKINAVKDGRSWHIFDDLPERNNSANSGNDFAIVEWLKKQNEELQTQNAELVRQLAESMRQAEENQKRSDTIIMHLTKQLENQTLMLEDMRHRSLWKRVKTALGFSTRKPDEPEIV